MSDIVLQLLESDHRDGFQDAAPPTGYDPGPDDLTDDELVEQLESWHKILGVVWPASLYKAAIFPPLAPIDLTPQYPYNQLAFLHQYNTRSFSGDDSWASLSFVLPADRHIPHQSLDIVIHESIKDKNLLFDVSINYSTLPATPSFIVNMIDGSTVEFSGTISHLTFTMPPLGITPLSPPWIGVANIRADYGDVDELPIRTIYGWTFYSCRITVLD